MYTALLTVHSWLRWVVLLAALLVLLRAIAGVAQRRPLIGLIIYFFLSPFTMSAWSDIGGAMRDAATRFVVIEHQVGMFIAVALAHIGRARIRKAGDDARRHRLALIFFGLAFVIMVASIPWPGRPSGRALFRGFD